jgi:hypothetical protein
MARLNNRRSLASRQNILRLSVKSADWKTPISDQNELAIRRLPTRENPFANFTDYDDQHKSGVNGRSPGNLIHGRRWPVFAPLSLVGIGLSSRTLARFYLSKLRRVVTVPDRKCTHLATESALAIEDSASPCIYRRAQISKVSLLVEVAK